MSNICECILIITSIDEKGEKEIKDFKSSAMIGGNDLCLKKVLLPLTNSEDMLLAECVSDMLEYKNCVWSQELLVDRKNELIYRFMSDTIPETLLMLASELYPGLEFKMYYNYDFNVSGCMIFENGNKL